MSFAKKLVYQFDDQSKKSESPWRIHGLVKNYLHLYTIKNQRIHVDGNIYLSTRPHEIRVIFKQTTHGDSSLRFAAGEVLRLVRPLHRIRIIELDLRGSVVQLVPGIFWEHRRWGGVCCLMCGAL